MVAVPSSDAPELFARLLQQDIVTSFRNGNIRATIHFYNSEEDIDRFIEAMAGHRARLGPRA
jgi:selenocysteine lyase/cysteine desulfurase